MGKVVLVKEYLMHKLEPREHVLSPVISKAMNPKGDVYMEKVMCFLQFFFFLMSILILNVYRDVLMSFNQWLTSMYRY